MRILVLRFSAMGDVALLVPVLHQLQKAHPKAEITVVSQPFLAPLFKSLRLEFFAADVKKEYSGFGGLGRLARLLKKRVKPDVVVDVHAVLRTHILKVHFRAMGVKVVQLQKDRAGRKALTAYPNKTLKPLRHSAENYCQTFAKAGFTIPFSKEDRPQLHYPLESAPKKYWLEERNSLNLGIAPFAQHQAKSWPLAKMEKLLQALTYPNLKLWFFGGPQEAEALQALGQSSGKAFTVVAGRFALDQEIALMQNLQAFVAMDSGNMHLASLAGVPVVSIWGGTHPYAGFAPLGQKPEWQVQLREKELDCRPCSAFGAKPCFRGDYACLQQLGHERVLATLSSVIKEYL